MDLRDRQELYNGFGDGLARAFELAVTPAVFGLLGWGIDSVVGTFPLFTILLALFAVSGVGYMAWVRYEQDMQRHEADAVWNRHKRERSERSAA